MAGRLYDCADINSDGCLENVYVSECYSDRISKLDTYPWVFYELSVPDKQIHSLAITQTEIPQIFIGTESSGLYVSNSAYANASWNRITLDGRPDIILTHPKDPTTIYVVTLTRPGGKVFISEDLGHTWKEILKTEQPISSFTANPLNPNTLYVGLRQPSYGIMISTDKGQSWMLSSWSYLYSKELIDGLIPWDIEVDPITSYIYASGEIGNHPQPYPGENYPPLFRSTDDGQTWQLIQKKGMWHVTDIESENGRVYFQEEGHDMYTSSDNGVTFWGPVSTGFADFVVLPNTGVLLGFGAMTNTRGVFVSNDAGNNFDYVGLYGDKFMKTALNAELTEAYFAGYDVGLWRTNLPRKLTKCKNENELCQINLDCCSGSCCSRRGSAPVCKGVCQ
jgi:photosystem II stability/assembly factor-like uncharacterized protein